jgi:Protein of unknown function (DUF2975)
MTTNPNGTVLKVTRGFIFLFLGLLALAGLAMAVASVAVPFFWQDIVTEVAKSSPEAQLSGLLPPILALLAFAIVILGLVWTILRKLLAMIATVAEGDPFVRANAVRLKAIGWLMVAIQIIGIPMGALVGWIGERLHETDMHGDFSISGILAILLVFVLAGVFEKGAAMREELEGTV